MTKDNMIFVFFGEGALSNSNQEKRGYLSSDRKKGDTNAAHLSVSLAKICRRSSLLRRRRAPVAQLERGAASAACRECEREGAKSKAACGLPRLRFDGHAEQDASRCEHRCRSLQ